MSTIIIADVDLDCIYDTFDKRYLQALRALRDTERTDKATALGLMHLLTCHVARCGSARSIARVTRTCDALIRRYGEKTS